MKMDFVRLIAPLQGSTNQGHLLLVTQGVALGWVIAGRWPAGLVREIMTNR
jgi:hypothetical protein